MADWDAAGKRLLQGLHGAGETIAGASGKALDGITGNQFGIGKGIDKFTGAVGLAYAEADLLPPDAPESQYVRAERQAEERRQMNRANYRFRLPEQGDIRVRPLRASEAMGLPQMSEDEEPAGAAADRSDMRATPSQVRSYLKAVGWGDAEIADIMDGPPFHLGERNFRVRLNTTDEE